VSDAVIVAVTFVGVADVVIGNVALVAPAATVTVAGTVATVLEDDRLTTKPPVGALPFVKVTVPVADVPPGTAVGLIVRPDT
jgi:hypothetical protein